jgi:hypothetical protein
MLVGVPEQIAHVEVVKVDSSNFPGSFFHWRSRVNCGAKAALGEAQNYPPKRAQRLGPTKPSRSTHHSLPHQFPGSVQSISGNFMSPNFGMKPQMVLP